MRQRADPSLDERVARLERMVAEIHAHLGLPAERGAVRAPSPPAPEPRLPRAERWAHLSEQWLGRVGLGLLFLGLVYLFNYSIEQGWITPVVRVAVGLAIGSALLVFGLRTRRGRGSYSQLLLAGAIAAYYVTGFAAYQLYALVSHGLAFLFLTLVMVLALVLARRQDRPSLASLGALGGLVTPLLLHRQSAAVVDLAAYAVLVIGWAGVLFWLRGWLSLLWTYAVGGLATLGIAASHAAVGQRWVVAAALGFCWALSGALPFVREHVRPHTARGLRRSWRVVPLPFQLRILGVGVTTAALYLVIDMWSLSDDASGALFLVLALAYGVFAWLGTRKPSPAARAAAPVAAALCAAAAFLLLHRAGMVAGVSILAALFVFAGSRARFAGTEWVGHTLYAILAVALVAAIGQPPRSALDPLGWAQFLQIVLLVVASRYVAPPAARWAYRLAAHALFLVWLALEAGALALGTGAVTLAWGLYGAVLLVAALQWRRRGATFTLALQLVAFSALALAVLKLLFVDLSRVAMLWRILLFLGFGGAFLGLSSLFKPRARGEEPDVAN
ncbi:MAG TPA: DUF2339 domain-containing protein [Longimicrobiaceae bacterium]|nr:DUF2339 domain-containing protein [Longimicrobiaceae bacterium]